MATFYNQATLSYAGNVVNSNTTEAELLSGLELTKRSVTESYTAGSEVVYAVTLSNMGSVSYNALTISDDLGAYALSDETTVVPLTYVDGSILYYLNGILQPAPTVSTVGNLVIEGINLPPNSTATFIYATKSNEFAPVSTGSVITNTVTTNGGLGVGEITATATVNVLESPELTIAKAVCPAVINDNERVTYTIIVQNLGNVPINATDGVIIRDTFSPILSELTVELNGTALEEGTGYTYNAASGEFATIDGVITVPAATYTQDLATGTITTTPGVTVLTITGRV
ncbi:MAG: hypothetical protein E7612_09500 [Ruminococcaceae bacterium]|nr:hypothetical protein [Oscillospiraceae bacterium]